MKYSNKPIPEGINTSTAHPLRTFFTLLVFFLIILAAGSWFLGKSGAWIATLIPLEQELVLAKNLDFLNSEESQMQRYLQALASDLAQTLEISEGFPVSVHYVSDSTVNAFATIGGHVIFYRGLLQELRSENALAMLIAHELAHVKHRHPIASMGQGLAIEIGFRLLLNQSDLQIANLAGHLTQLKFSRSMESDADRDALKAVYHRYRHVNGAMDLYDVLLLAGGSQVKGIPAFMATHPLTGDRLEALNTQAKNNSWQSTGELTSLPAEYSNWLSR